MAKSRAPRRDICFCLFPPIALSLSLSLSLSLFFSPSLAHLSVGVAMLLSEWATRHSIFQGVDAGGADLRLNRRRNGHQRFALSERLDDKCFRIGRYRRLCSFFKPFAAYFRPFTTQSSASTINVVHFVTRVQSCFHSPLIFDHRRLLVSIMSGINCIFLFSFTVRIFHELNGITWRLFFVTPPQRNPF